MGDTYRRLTPGDRVRGPNADLNNILVDLARDWTARTRGQDSADGNAAEDVQIENASGDVLDEFSVVGLADSIIDPDVNPNEFTDTVGFESTQPTTGGRFAILQTTLGDRDVGAARISGQTWVQVDFSDSSHEFAGPYHNNYTNLVSQAEPGPARILSKEDGAGLLWAQVSLESAGSGSGGSAGQIETDFGTAAGPTYVFQVSDEGDDFIIGADESTVTWFLPDASKTARGLITAGVQSLNGNKLFYEGSSNGRVQVQANVGVTVEYITPVLGLTLIARLGFGTLYLADGAGGNVVAQYSSGGASGDYLELVTSRTPGGYAVNLAGGGTVYGVTATDASGNTLTGGIVTGFASGLPYSAGNASHWAGAAPTTVKSALDRIAAAVYNATMMTPIP